MKAEIRRTFHERRSKSSVEQQELNFRIKDVEFVFKSCRTCGCLVPEMEDPERFDLGQRIQDWWGDEEADVFEAVDAQEDVAGGQEAVKGQQQPIHVWTVLKKCYKSKRIAQ